MCVCDNQTGLSCLSGGIYSDVTHNTIAEKENFHATSGFMKYCQHLRGFTWSVIVINGYFTHLRAFLNEIKLDFVFGILDHFNCTCTSKKGVLKAVIRHFNLIASVYICLFIINSWQIHCIRCSVLILLQIVKKSPL